MMQMYIFSDVYKRQVQDYIVMRLVGAKRPLLHVTNAAGFGLFDFSSMTFDAAAIKKAGMTPDFLPKVISDLSLIHI